MNRLAAATLCAVLAASSCTGRPVDGPPADEGRGAATRRARPSAVPTRPEAAPGRSEGGDRRPEAWLIWTLGGLEAGLPSAVRRLGPIRSVASVASGTAWSRAWTDADGEYRGAPGGLAYPFEVAAMDPRAYGRFVPPGVARTLRRLGQGDALAARTAARVHGLGAGARMRVGGVRIRIEGVIPDAFAGSHELVVTEAAGRRLGIETARYLLARAEDAALRRTVARAIRAVVEGVPARIRAPGEAAFLRHADLTLPQSRLKALFGAFAAAPAGGWFDVERRWVRSNIVEARVPILGRVECHRRIVPLVRGALRELARRGLGRLVDRAQYGGCYAPRFIGRDPGAGLSHHAWGVAIDINVADNPLGAEPTMDPRVVRTFERWGFVWGGDFIRPDGHHFEFRCFPSRCAERT